MNNICVCIPTYRKPPITTLAHYNLGTMKLVIVADPSVFKEHQQYYPGQDYLIAMGKPGICAQVSRCYEVAAIAGFEWYFRLDDDLPPQVFMHKDGHKPNLPEVITACYECATQMNVSLAGVNNTVNRHWMGEGYTRTWGLITGGAHLCKSSLQPKQFIDETLTHYEDVWRSLAHRKADGAVGRVNHIGINKAMCTGSASMDNDPDRLRAIKKICDAFPGMITCDSTKIVNGSEVIANWKFRKGPKR
jgi:hypothetical protein